MEALQHWRKFTFFSELVLLGALYNGLIAIHFSFTGIPQLDGIPGVMLGLFTCAHLVTSFMESFLYGRRLTPKGLSLPAVLLWWWLNSVMLVVGMGDIVSGLMRYSEIR